jgi:murein L,D-transpeptidase YcbB/YkuD
MGQQRIAMKRMIVLRLALAVCLANAASQAVAQQTQMPQAAEPSVSTAPAASAPSAPPAASALAQERDQAATQDTASSTPAAAPSEPAAPAATPVLNPEPDPLTPPEVVTPAPIAPGAPAQAPVVTTAAAPEIDPIAPQILVRASQNSGGKSENKEDVSALAAYYKETNGKPVWVTKDGFNARAKQAFQEIRNADNWGLEASAFQLPELSASQAAPEALADAEIKLSLAVLKYARYARGGRLDPPSLSAMLDRRPHIYEPKSVLQAIAAADTADGYLRDLHPKHEPFRRLQRALAALRNAPADGPNPVKLPSGPNIKPGQEHPQIELLHTRLSVAAEPGRAAFYDNALLDAVNRYQKEHGLEATGIVDRKLRASLNDAIGGTLEEKRERIVVNMERWRWMPDDLGEFYVWDSIPEQLTRVIDHGKVTLMERIVVGKPHTPTPTFTANMQFIIFHPEWGVPDGIKRNEIGPRLRQAGGGGFFLFGGGSRVLDRLGLRVSINGRPVDPDSVDWSSVDIRRYQFTQGAGGRNVLGVVKFRFPNKHDVYMHDTPDRHLFSEATRAFSHGCMRTQNPVHLAEVLLAHDQGYSVEKVQSILAAGATNEIKLTTQIPVHVVYFTAEADDDGKVRYFGDLYGMDGRIASALKGLPVHFNYEQTASADDEPRPQRADRNARARSERRAQRGSFSPWGPFQDWN